MGFVSPADNLQNMSSPSHARQILLVVACVIHELYQAYTPILHPGHFCPQTLTILLPSNYILVPIIILKPTSSINLSEFGNLQCPELIVILIALEYR